MKNSDKLQLPNGLREVFTARKDTEGNAIELDYQYELYNGFISEAIGYLRSKYGNKIAIVPIGGQSAGGGVFYSDKRKIDQLNIGLIIPAAVPYDSGNELAYTISDKAPPSELRSHDVHINSKDRLVYVGAGVVLDQIVATVKKAMGKNFSVLGTDLTSSGYASSGATFMTGGMGPTRINFARSVSEISYYDGETTLSVANRVTLNQLAETYGWTGMVQSLTLPIYEIPQHAFGFALPINNTPEELGTLVSYFADKTKIPQNGIVSKDAFIAGLEIITGDALNLLEKETPNLEGLDVLLQNCRTSSKDAVVFISGAANANPFEDYNDPLGIFVSNELSGLSLEQATPFSNLQAMKNIREGAPELARRQFLDAPFCYKDHTDINVQVNLKNTFASTKAIMLCYERYKIKLEQLIESENDLKGNVQVYGHINPQGLDPHYRVTLVSSNKETLDTAEKKARTFYGELVKDISRACKNTGSQICGGEKGIISNMKVLNALKKYEEFIPRELQNRLKQQQKAIAHAHPMFNWRAKA